MPEKKIQIIEAIGKELPSMTETEKTYLMGFMEGVSAITGLDKLVRGTASGGAH